MDGLVLLSPIDKKAIFTEEKAISFSESEQEKGIIENTLKNKQEEYLLHSLFTTFEWDKMIDASEHFIEALEKKQNQVKEIASELAGQIFKKTLKQKEVADKFLKQLESLVAEKDLNQLHSRMSSASAYFEKVLDEEVINLLNNHYEEMKHKARVKKYLRELYNLREVYKRKKEQLQRSVAITKGLCSGKEAASLLEEIRNKKENTVTENKPKVFEPKPKAPKGESHRISLQLFKEGKTIQEIAEVRSMALGTIGGHLASFIPTGELSINEIVSPEKIKIIESAIEQLKEYNLSSVIKQHLGEEYSYFEIQAVLKTINKNVVR